MLDHRRARLQEAEAIVREVLRGLDVADALADLLLADLLAEETRTERRR